MNTRTLKSTVLLAGVSLACFGFSTAARAAVSASFTGDYTTVFSDSDGTLGAGTYGANINGTTSSSKILCDDYSDNLSVGETWDADAQQSPGCTAENSGDMSFGNSSGFTGYAEVATLGSMSFDNIATYGSISGITRPELTSAIWNVTNAGNTGGLDANATALVAAVTTTFSGPRNTAQGYSGSLGNMWILTPNPHVGFGLEPRGMFIRHLNVPEGGSPLLYLILAGFSCFSALLVSRRRSHGARH